MYTGKFPLRKTNRAKTPVFKVCANPDCKVEYLPTSDRPSQTCSTPCAVKMRAKPSQRQPDAPPLVVASQPPGSPPPSATPPT